jgi:hypothetical protein
MRGDAKRDRRNPKKAAEEEVTTANEAAISKSRGVVYIFKAKINAVRCYLSIVRRRVILRAFLTT